MQGRYFALIAVLLTMVIIPTNVYAEHVLAIDAFGQYLDISQLESDKVTFVFDEKEYDIYYGYSGSLDDMSSSASDPVLSSMDINQENKSIEIVMESVPEKTDFWVRIPDEVLYAENEQFTVLIDGKDIGYDLMKFPTDHVVGFIIDEDTETIEIIGTRVIPEFGAFTVLVLFASVFTVVLLLKKTPLLMKFR